MSFGSGGARSGAPTREEKAKRQKIAAWVVGIAGGFIPLVALIGVLSFLLLYATTTIPSPDEVKQNQVATILDSQGHVISKIVPPAGNRTDVKFEDIPEPVRQAVIAAEDRDFESNSGFSISGLTRAFWGQLTGNADAGGGSTITQQYVKNAIVGDQHSYIRKFKELAISTKMSNEWTKDEILGAYLNTIYYGRGAYGIASAWKAYFNEDITKLKYDQMDQAQRDALVAKAAVVASSIRSPSYYDPANNLAAAQTRWSYVLDGMVSTKYLTKEQRDQFTLAQYPKVAPPPATDSADPQSNGPNGLIKQQVLSELESIGISEQQVQTEGLKITTGIDQQAQAAAVKAAKTNLENDPNPDDPKSAWRTAITSIDPQTGRVEAYFGGTDGHGYDYAQAALQAGSSFKVFALLAALEQNIPLSKVYSSAPFQAPGSNVTITNSDGESCGSCNLATALKMSLNTVYYRLMMDLQGQAQAVADAAHAAGIAESFGDISHTLQEPDGSVQGGVVLGQYGVRVIDMASAYATIAASGIYRPAHFVTKVETSDGTVLYTDGDKAKGERKFSAAVADNTTAAMVPIASYSNGHGLSDPETGSSRPSAAKTGTTQLGDTGQNKDAWMVGYTPQLSTAVWMGTNGAVALKNSYGGIMYGSGTPSAIWQETMNGALAGRDIKQFPEPTAIGGQAGVPYDAPAYTYQPTRPRRTTEDFPGQNQLPSAVTLAPGVTIPLPGNGNANPNSNNGTDNGGNNGTDNGGVGNGGVDNGGGNGNRRNNGEANPVVPGLGQ